MNDTLLLGNINTKPSANKQKAPALKPAVKREKPSSSFENAGARFSKLNNPREFANKTQFKPKVQSFNPTAFKISPANRGGFSRIPKPPPPPNSLNQRDNDFKSNSSNHQFIKPSNQEKDVRSKFQFNTSTFKTSKLFDSDTFKEINEIEALEITTNKEELFSSSGFADFQCNPHLVACLKQRFSLETATKVQSLSIPPLIAGKDALIKSATGSGKTLAYSIPLVQRLQAVEPKITRTSGLYALVIVPTRELALQTYDCLSELLNPFRRIVLGILVGGEKKKSEKARIRKGLNILVATPGRLLDHLGHTETLRLEKLQCLVIDEADRLYEQGFSAIIGQIMEYIQKRFTDQTVQTILLSATLSKGVKELAGLSLKNPEIIDVGDESEQRMDQIVLPDSLENCYMIVPTKLRLVMLACILLKAFNTGTSKVIVFMSCQDVVDYFSVLFSLVLNKLFKVDIESSEDEDDDEGEDKKNDHQEDEANLLTILQLHGNMNQCDRTAAFKKFHNAAHGILLCTDVVSRGLDLPNVDLVVQMSVPPLVEDYVHRVGRTARVGSKGRSILVLLPSETKFVHHLQGHIPLEMNAVKVEQYMDTLNKLALFESNKQLHTEQERLAFLQHLFEEAVVADENLHSLAAKAYLSHLRAYASYPHKMSYCLPFKEIHLGHLAKSFALLQSPSELGANFSHGRRPMRTNKIKDTTSLKRRNVAIEDRCSEFGGGIITGKEKKVNKRQRT